MAATTTELYRANFKCTLQRGTENESRNIYFDSNFKSVDSIASAAESVAESLVGAYNKFIQPTGWRDNDVTEDEWITIGVTPSIEHNIEITLDEVTPPDGQNAKKNLTSQ